MYRIRKSAGGDRRARDRRKDLTEEEFRKLVESEFPDRRKYDDRRDVPRRKTDPGKKK
jgi:hypothetical protein